MRRSSASAIWHAMRWPGLGSRTGGARVSQMEPILRGQRVWNGQPVGGSVTLGGLPGRITRRFRTEVSGIGTAESSASV